MEDNKKTRDALIEEFLKERERRRIEANRQISAMQQGGRQWREWISAAVAGVFLVVLGGGVVLWVWASSWVRKLRFGTPAMTTTLVLPPQFRNSGFSLALRVGKRESDGNMQMDSGLVAYDFEQATWVRVEDNFDYWAGIYQFSSQHACRAKMEKLVRGRLPYKPTHWYMPK